MVIIIRDELVYPPTWLPSFRDLTLWATVRQKCEVVVESDCPDSLYSWLKPVEALDFVKDFVRPKTQEGIRVDNAFRHGVTIWVSKIEPENVWTILNAIDRLLIHPADAVIDLSKGVPLS